MLLVDGRDSRRAQVEECLLDRHCLRMACPLAPGDFVDFFSSYHHALRTARLARPDAELNPNWTSLPVGYHSRTGTIVGTDETIMRPRGQYQTSEGVVFAPTRALDIELEIGFVIGRGSRRGQPIGVKSFADHVFGLVLLNDWSARDIQRWESFPLGPFLAKSFATQLGPWVVPLEALEPYRRKNPNAVGALSYLRHDEAWSFDISLTVAIASREMRAAGRAPHVVSTTNFVDMYWDGAQQLAHLTANGASTRPGDLYGSGTVSGPSDDSAGCLLELTAGGSKPVALPDGTSRGYLQDGDRVVLTGVSKMDGHAPIDFGALSGIVAPPAEDAAMDNPHEDLRR
jgi:fumarylacetoacetase